MNQPEKQVNYDDLIPNNVNLSEDRALRRALEQWHPKFIEWWKDMGPEGFQESQVYLRTAVGVDPKGWAVFDYVTMPEYRWGILLADKEEGRTIPFGKHKGEPVLVVAHYIHERKRLLEEFPEAREFHEDDVPAWQAGEIPLWIAQSKQISHGIDGLQDSGRIIIWVTQTHSWETYTQLIHRLVRPGQKHETLIYRLLCADTIDWAVAATLKEKKEGERGMMAAIHALQQLRKTQ